VRRCTLAAERDWLWEGASTAPHQVTNTQRRQSMSTSSLSSALSDCLCPLSMSTVFTSILWPECDSNACPAWPTAAVAGLNGSLFVARPLVFFYFFPFLSSVAGAPSVSCPHGQSWQQKASFHMVSLPHTLPLIHTQRILPLQCLKTNLYGTESSEAAGDWNSRVHVHQHWSTT